MFGYINKLFEEIFNKIVLLKKVSAFTLAETLIVIGIIGVVASLTIPNLNSTTADKEKIARAKKVYAQINEAFERAQAVYGPYEEWGMDYSDRDTFEKLGRIFEFTKVSKECKMDGLYNSSCINISDNSPLEDGFADTGYGVILADGTGVAISLEGGLSCIIDIDGPQKGKNKAGYDQFLFFLDNKNYTYYQDQMTGDLSLYPGVEISGSGATQTQNPLYMEWILKNDNMDFTKVDSSYNCPDGSPLNWETKISCK